MAEHVLDEGVEVARARSEIVVAVRGEAGSAEAAQIGHDDLKAGSRKRRDIPPPDPHRLGPTVDEQKRVAAGALTHVGKLDPIANLSVLNGKHAS